MTDDLVEKVIDAMSNCGSETVGSRMARAAIAVVLEEAAKVAENASFQFTQNTPRSVEVVDVRHTIAAAIRALAKQSTTEEERA